MNFIEYINQSFASIKSNMLRTVLTASIIAMGIMALVGILTTIDGMKASVDSSFSDLGANSFDILVQNSNRRNNGVEAKRYPPIYYRQAMDYKQKFSEKEGAIVSVNCQVSGSAEVKQGSIKSNPNIQVLGVDADYFAIKGNEFAFGRNLTDNDGKFATNVAILGSELAKTLFPTGDPIGKFISAMGEKYNVVGVLEAKGSMNGGGGDRALFIPLSSARKFDTNGRFTYNITNASPNVENMDFFTGEATAIMRTVRGDKIGEEDSFVIERADALSKEIDEISGYLKAGGFGISFITLLGASIALMNIMLVSVTERTREIGVRKAIGATQEEIRNQFLIEAIIICIMGGLAGIFLGLLMGNVVAKFANSDTNFIVPWNWIGLGLTVCIAVGILSGFLPARKAASLDPIESLRYE